MVYDTCCIFCGSTLEWVEDNSLSVYNDIPDDSDRIASEMVCPKCKARVTFYQRSHEEDSEYDSDC